MAAREDEHCGFPDSIHVRTMARRRGSPPGSPRLGSSAGRLETSADLKRRSTKAFQLESSNSARNFGKTLRFARFFIIGSLVTAFITWENHFRPRPGVLTDLPEAQGAIDELLKPRMGTPDPAETQAMLRRVEKAYLDVPRSAFNPTKYTPPNPALTIPRNLDILLADIDKPHSPSDVPFFWHILKSGGTTTKDAAGMCLKKVEASESGILEGHQLDQVIQKVHLSGGAIEYVNVDTTSSQGIQRAISMGLVESGLSDVIFSPLLHEASQLFNNTSHKGRAFCLFRHPVERAVSLFHYLKKADWEPTFSEKLKKMSLEDYAISEFAENNWMTRFLTNEMTGAVTRQHLEVGKEILRRKVLVGLTVDMENSFERFSKYLGWDKDPLSIDQRHCLKGFLTGGSNRNKHAIAEEETTGWRILRGNNLLDLELYDYALQLYQEQGKVLGL